MRVFLSAYSGFTLAVPMDAVAAMMLPPQKMENIVQYDQQSRNTYVSLPRLFNLPNEAVGHGIVLREWNSKANKVVLLTAEVKRDLEIPDEEFHPIPKALSALRFSQMFSGIQFSDNPIILLNIKQLAEVIQKEQYIINEKKNQPIPEPEEKSEPQIIAEEKESPVTVEEKSEPQITTEKETEPPVTIEKEKEPPVTKERIEPQTADKEDDSLVIDEIIELQAIDEEEEPRVTVEECKQPVTEGESEPQATEEEKNPQITIDEENEPRILIKESEQQIIVEEIKQPIING